MEKGQAKTPKNQEKKTIITYRRVSKRLAVETTSLLLFIFYYSPSLLKSKHAISITYAEMHANHIVSSGSPHNVLHFSSNNWGEPERAPHRRVERSQSIYYYYYICMVRPSPARRYRDCTGVRDIFQHDLEAA